MPTFVPLKFTSGVSEVKLNDLNGFSELLLEKNNSENLILFLESLITTNNGEKFDAKKIAIADRDRIIAELFIKYFGEKIESTISCKNCSQKFDLDFSLKNILTNYLSNSILTPKNGIYKIDGICEFRLPTGEDELAIKGLTNAEAERYLYEKCILKGKIGAEKLQEMMEEIAPVLNINLQAACPECNAEQDVKFDMQSFFITKFLQEKPKLIAEIHALASSYHWTKNEILELPRSLRKQFYGLIKG